jgi:hypothetical protein
MVRGSSGWGAFIGLIAGMSAVGVVNFGPQLFGWPDVAFLWLNVVGAVVVVVVGMAVSLFARPRRPVVMG